MSTTLPAIIRRHKPRAALLTTYALSLSYFEAAILSVLKSTYCHDTVLLVDAEQVLASLAETRSMGAGRTYRLLPVASPGGGFFHPKIAYLECETEDVLVIGSGNLTFGGQGGNLECIDAIISAEQPAVFGEFAHWCHQLGSQLADRHPLVSQQLGAFGRRAQMQAQKFRNNQARTAWLVHTATEPAADQFLRIANGMENWSTLRVLSPFHSPDGTPLLAIANHLSVQSLEVGVKPDTNEAPLDGTLFLPNLPVKYVRPRLDEVPRELHAKWFELLSSEHALVMTGSVNATAQSLQTLRNVEVSLIRLLPGSPVAWEETEPKGFAPTRFELPPPGLTRISLDATQLPSGRIDIQLHRQTDSQAVRVTLYCAGQVLQAWDNLSLPEDGHLVTPACDLSRAALTVTVRVESSQFQADGVLTLETKLSGAELDSDHQAALARLAEGNGLPSDSVIFLQLLLQLAQSSSPAPSVRGSALSKRTSNSPVEDSGAFSYRDWVHSGRHSHLAGLAVSPARLMESLAGLFNPESRLRPNEDRPARRLLSDEQSQDISDEPGQTDSPLDAFRHQQAELKQLLRTTIPLVLKSQAEHPFVIPLLFYLLAEAIAHSKSMVGRVAVDHAFSSCTNWLQQCSELHYTNDMRDAVLPVAVAVAGWLASQYEAKGMTPPLERLCAPLERIAGTGLSALPLLELVTTGLAHPLLCSLTESEQRQVHLQVQRFAHAGSLDKTLADTVQQALYNPKYKPEARIEALFPGIAERLRGRGHNAKPPYGFFTPTPDRIPYCPCCYMPLHADVLRLLKQSHAAVCPRSTCNKVILHLEDPQLRMQLREEPAHV